MLDHLEHDVHAYLVIRTENVRIAFDILCPQVALLVHDDSIHPFLTVHGIHVRGEHSAVIACVPDAHNDVTGRTLGRTTRRRKPLKKLMNNLLGGLGLNAHDLCGALDGQKLQQ